MALAGRVALVVGGASGIGEAVVRRFARESPAGLVVADLNLEGAQKVAASVKECRAIGVRVNVADEDEVNAMVAAAVAEFQALHVVVNSAGIGLQKAFLNITKKEYERVVAINLVGSFLVGRAAVHQMLRQSPAEPCAIIQLASITAHRGAVGRAAYGASKAAVVNLTQTMGLELGTTHIRTAAICPGPVNTELARQHHVGETRQAFVEDVPMRRYAEPEEIAGPAVFLASRDASYCTGTVLYVDGGYAGSGLLKIPLEGVHLKAKL